MRKFRYPYGLNESYDLHVDHDEFISIVVQFTITILFTIFVSRFQYTRRYVFTQILELILEKRKLELRFIHILVRDFIIYTV